MAITRGSFQNIPSSKPNQPHQPVPAKLVPAQEWAVSYFFSYEMDATELISYKEFDSTLILRVYNSANTVKYEVTIKERFSCLVMSPGGVSFYSWQWIPQREKIEGRKGTSPGAPLMKTLGQGTFGVDPPQQGGYGDNSAVIIEGRYYSGIFREPLDRGDSFEVYRHTVDSSRVVKEARLQLATELGGVSCALHDPRVGTVWHAAPQSPAPPGATARGAALRSTSAESEASFGIVNTRRVATFAPRGSALVTSGSPIFAKLLRRGATLFLVSLRPFGDGLTLDVQTSVDAGATWETNAMLLDDFRVLAAQLSLDGGTMWLYGLARAEGQNANAKPVPSRAVLRRGEGGWKASDKAAIRYLDVEEAAKAATQDPDAEPPVPPPPLPETGVVTLEVSGNTLHLVAGGDADDSYTTNPVRIWESTDELASLHEAKISDSEAAEDKKAEGG